MKKTIVIKMEDGSDDVAIHGRNLSEKDVAILKQCLIEHGMNITICATRKVTEHEVF